MNRIIKITDSVTGRLTEREKTQSTLINMNPVFTEEKPWKFIKVLRTSTKIVPWLIQIGEEYIVVTQGYVQRKTEMCMFYRSNKRGTFNVSSERLAEYWMYVDMEAAVDKFYKENYEPIVAEPLNEPEHETEA